MMKTRESLVALITGGNRGLGLQTARELGSRKISVVLGVRDLSKAEAATASLRKAGIHVETVRVDLANASTHDEVFDFLTARYGRLDILVNNAAVWLEDAPPEAAGLGGNRTSTLPQEILWKTFQTNFFWYGRAYPATSSPRAKISGGSHRKCCQHSGIAHDAFGLLFSDLSLQSLCLRHIEDRDQQFHHSPRT
jgi:NAD(P)-dependent dehydrogenase (short-subunit alcohol dehydrogenase family)